MHQNLSFLGIKNDFCLGGTYLSSPYPTTLDTYGASPLLTEILNTLLAVLYKGVECLQSSVQFSIAAAAAAAAAVVVFIGIHSSKSTER